MNHTSSSEFFSLTYHWALILPRKASFKVQCQQASAVCSLYRQYVPEGSRNITVCGELENPCPL